MFWSFKNDDLIFNQLKEFQSLENDVCYIARVTADTGKVSRTSEKQ